MLATMMTNRSLVWLFGAITVGLLVGVVVGRMPGLSEASAEATVSDRPADETIQYVLDAGVLGEAHIYALDWSTDDNLWLVGSQSDGKVILSRYEPGSGTLAQWTLPGSASPFHTSTWRSKPMGRGGSLPITRSGASIRRLKRRPYTKCWSSTILVRMTLLLIVIRRYPERGLTGS